MTPEDLVTMCARMVMRQRRRYKSVFLAICLGILGFIVILSSGNAVEKRMGEHLIILGGATILDAKWENFDNQHPGEFTSRDISALKKIASVLEVAPLVSKDFLEVSRKDRTWNARITAVDDSFFRTIMASVRFGRTIKQSDVAQRKTVCVLGRDVAEFFFSGWNPVGSTIQVGHSSFEIIGVLGGIQGDDTHRSIFVPITAAQDRLDGYNTIEAVRIRVDWWNNVVSARQKIVEVLKTIRGGNADGLRVVHYPERIRRVSNSAYLVKMLVYLGLAATIILGGLGIMNLMLSAISERTREIGLKKAVGATRHEILLQFLIETSIVSFSAGVAGVLAGIICLQIMKSGFGILTPPVLKFIGIIIGLVLSLAVGILSGIYPALKASRLDVVSALRFE